MDPEEVIASSALIMIVKHEITKKYLLDDNNFLLLHKNYTHVLVSIFCQRN